jgi:hypothetical protein
MRGKVLGKQALPRLGLGLVPPHTGPYCTKAHPPRALPYTKPAD